MWYRSAQKYDKQRPNYEIKVIGIDAEYAIRKLLHLQGKYNPSNVEIERKIKKLISHLENKYGSIANVRLYTKGDSLEEIISENVYELFGKNRSNG